MSSYLPNTSAANHQEDIQDDIQSHSDSGYGSILDAHSEIPLATPAANNNNNHQSLLQQIRYNDNRARLARAIDGTANLLRNLKDHNDNVRPSHYPRCPRSQIIRSQSSFNEPESDRPNLRRGFSSLEGTDEKSEFVDDALLVNSSVESDINVLKLDLRVEAHESESLHTLEAKSIGSLLSGRFTKSLRQLDSLKTRIDDTSSKIFVTGDLNAGKSTFCNALLRKQILPEDQQPCTNVFCEVLDARENGSIEEAHAVPHGVSYSRLDERTYQTYPLEQLDDIVDDSVSWAQVKVYVDDNRSIDQSLLRNGVVDIALIDAPGLNLDSLKTTAVFARQEEIDVVVFVVSAENHFTLSAKEFIWNAANEKAYIFIVVNRFDNIKAKDRCRRLILEQIEKMSPQTYKDSSELVHFVSSNAVLDPLADPSKVVAFENLERSLRQFILVKRSKSKLAPAKTYLELLHRDIHTITSTNKGAAEKEYTKAEQELSLVTPEYESTISTRNAVSDSALKIIEETCRSVQKFTRKHLQTCLRTMDTPICSYPGFLSAWHYAQQTQSMVLKKVESQVLDCESFARSKTVSGVDAIRQLGLNSLKQYKPRQFNPHLMFSRRKDALERTISVCVLWSDFIDFDQQEKNGAIGMGVMAMTVLGGKFLSGKAILDGLVKIHGIGGHKLAGIVLAAIGIGVVAFAISDLPRAIPKNIAKRIQIALDSSDFIHNNSERIVRECRTVLNMPIEELRGCFQSSIEQQARKKSELEKIKDDSGTALRFYSRALKQSAEMGSIVGKIDLELD